MLSAKIMTPAQRLLMNRPVFPVYPYTQGDTNNQAPRIIFTQARPRVPAGFPRRIKANIARSAPTIQLFQAFGFPAAPYTHGDTKTQMPSSKFMPAVAFELSVATVPSLGMSILLSSKLEWRLLLLYAPLRVVAASGCE